jgi:hypothetical protein
VLSRQKSPSENMASSFLNSLQSNLQSSYEDERDLKSRLFGSNVRVDEETIGLDPASDLANKRVDPLIVGRLVPAAAAKAPESRGLPRTAAVPRDGRNRLREERHHDGELQRTVPSPDHRRQIRELAQQQHKSVDETIAWLLQLGHAHSALDRDEAKRRPKDAPSREKKGEKKREAKSAAVEVAPSLATVEDVLLRKDEEIEAIRQQLKTVEQKYVFAYARLTLADKRELLAKFKEGSTQTSSDVITSSVVVDANDSTSGVQQTTVEANVTESATTTSTSPKEHSE